MPTHKMISSMKRRMPLTMSQMTSRRMVKIFLTTQMIPPEMLPMTLLRMLPCLRKSLPQYQKLRRPLLRRLKRKTSGYFLSVSSVLLTPSGG